MSNSIALGLGVILVVTISVDTYFYGSDHLLFLGKKLANLIDWMAFWR
jgi:hypothetical protein